MRDKGAIQIISKTIHVHVQLLSYTITGDINFYIYTIKGKGCILDHDKRES